MATPYFDPAGADIRVSPPAPAGFNPAAVPPIPDEARRTTCPWCKESPLHSATTYHAGKGYLTEWTCWYGRHGSNCNYRKVI